MNLTPSLRRRLYQTMLDKGEIDTIDFDHRLVHALASVSDGPLQVRDDYGAIANGDDDLLTPEEIVHQAADYYGIGEVGPDDPVTVDLVFVATPLPGQPFDEEDLIDAVIATCHELFPHDGGDPVVPTIHTP